MLFIREENRRTPAATKTEPISRLYEGWIRPISGYRILSFHANLNAARMRFPRASEFDVCVLRNHMALLAFAIDYGFTSLTLIINASQSS